MPLDLLDGEALVGVADEDALDEVLALGRDLGVLGNAVVHPHDPVQHLLPQAFQLGLGLLCSNMIFNAVTCHINLVRLQLRPICGQRITHMTKLMLHRHWLARGVSRQWLC